MNTHARYDFASLLPKWLAGSLLTIGVIVTAVQSYTGNLMVGGYRFGYFILLMGGCILSWWAAHRRRFRFSWWLLAFLVVDLAFGVTTHKLSRNQGLGRSFLPENATQGRFHHHPLLQVVPTAGYRDRRNQHDPHGLRRTGEIVPDLPSIAAVGGSTTYDIGLKNGATWPDRLEGLLAGGANVLNFGVPGYSSAEQLIQTAFYLDLSRFNMRCAIYYLGWNDIRNAHLPDLDPGYADFHLPSQIDNLDARSRSFLNYFSTGMMLNRFFHLLFDTLPVAPDYRARAAVSGADGRLESHFRRHVIDIALLARARGMKALFVGQLLNPSALTGEGRYGWLPLVADRDVPALQRRFNEILDQAGQEHGFDVKILDQAGFSTDDFVDNGHFSESGAMKFAGYLEAWSRANCLSR
ncbi:MAG: hypothetical protein HQL86_09625 [Magnetococcales bacterium]|nr:hypothetical protein [Magnetococcales bacterium]